MHILFIFLDGVGLAQANPGTNPFTNAEMPFLDHLLDGRRLLIESVAPGIHATSRATLLSLDACLGISGLPQSATGQASLLTGLNIPALVGGHDGPKPNPAVQVHLSNGNLFNTLNRSGARVALLNAYPPRYFEMIRSGRRLPGAMAMAAIKAGLKLMTAEDLMMGRAISADFTGRGWHDHLLLPDTPILTPDQAGERLATLASGYTFSMFEYWLSDVVGHHQDMADAKELLSNLDTVLGSLFNSWNDDQGLILVTSDHGNLEDLSTRRHTTNPVPLLLVGASSLRERFIKILEKNVPLNAVPDLTRVAPVILDLLTN